jgi:hypothetical protein
MIDILLFVLSDLSPEHRKTHNVARASLWTLRWLALISAYTILVSTFTLFLHQGVYGVMFATGMFATAYSIVNLVKVCAYWTRCEFCEHLHLFSRAKQRRNRSNRDVFPYEHCKISLIPV